MIQRYRRTIIYEVFRMFLFLVNYGLAYYKGLYSFTQRLSKTRIMKRKIMYLFLSLAFVALSYSQSFETDLVSKHEIKKLQFIVGEWEGKGWIIDRDRTKIEFDQTENIQFKLDSTAILIEGLGIHNEKVIHNAMAIVSYNNADSNYTFQSYLQNGRKGEFIAEIKEGKFYWYPNDKMRYIIYLNDNGQWYETGEYKREEDWFQFFEMTLDKVE